MPNPHHPQALTRRKTRPSHIAITALVLLSRPLPQLSASRATTCIATSRKIEAHAKVIRLRQYQRFLSMDKHQQGREVEHALAIAQAGHREVSDLRPRLYN